MTEKELRQENEHLKRELAQLREDRDQLHQMLCALIPIDRTEITVEEFSEYNKEAKDVDLVLREVLPHSQHHWIGSRL